ncbi:lysylphosphatidylglycerol synthase transmembrane domain-containing protein [Alkalitalea saponilacus]|uniref:Lysylphosphatidylglycerol synthase TM region n=1 Tax=Alkalitalea saponilacus TaxID=889453 RepID=A0A1T5HT85_9BACT|nr:lysylphosphatidylglycerol synthase transmembrane domain-containing protein [Alkalitalea saponilacus]ASB48946.1 TIGR00374 family protein [Alkalitalea saponilacus]SKC23909.1 hypothetical protein SAMN03080601_03195 [Alkalitalea saponilacus]
MKTQKYKALQFVFFLLLGLGILWWLYKDQDPEELMNALQKEVNYFWIAAMIFIAFLSNLSRTIRWQMLVAPVDRRPGFINTFLALMIGYIANLAIPRMGELSRCAVLSRYENISFSRLVGTVVTERILDLIMLIISFSLVLVLEFGLLRRMLAGMIDISAFKRYFLTPAPYIFIFLLFMSFWFFRKKIKASGLFFRIQTLWEKFREGLLSFRKVIHKPWFIIHTLLIFFFYFLMMYISFQAFPATQHLSLLAGLTVFVFGTLGMVAPVQGGIGPWHFMVITALVGYHVPTSQAAVFALVTHGAFNLMVVVCGLISLLVLPLINPKKGKK